MQMDLLEFMKRFEFTSMAVCVNKTGQDETGRDLFSFYLCPFILDGDYFLEYIKVTFVPEILEMKLYDGMDDTGAKKYRILEGFTADNLVDARVGAGRFEVDERLTVCEKNWRRRNLKVLTIKDYNGFMCTIRNAMLDITGITQEDFRAVQSTYYKKVDYMCDERLNYVPDTSLRKTDLFDFVMVYDINDVVQAFTKVGEDENGRGIYTFYVAPWYVNGEYTDERFKVTLAPEIIKLQVCEDFYSETYKTQRPRKNPLDKLLGKTTGKGTVIFDDHLTITLESWTGKKEEVFTLESLDKWRATVRNCPVTVKKITKKEFEEFYKGTGV